MIGVLDSCQRGTWSQVYYLAQINLHISFGIPRFNNRTCFFTHAVITPCVLQIRVCINQQCQMTRIHSSRLYLSPKIPSSMALISNY